MSLSVIIYQDKEAVIEHVTKIYKIAEIVFSIPTYMIDANTILLNSDKLILGGTISNATIKFISDIGANLRVIVDSRKDPNILQILVTIPPNIHGSLIDIAIPTVIEAFHDIEASKKGLEVNLHSHKKEEQLPEEEQEETASSNPNELFVAKAKKAGKKGVLFFSGAADRDVRFLSNFYNTGTALEIHGKSYPTVEHYYQSEKARMLGFPDLSEQIRKVPAEESLKAKKLGGAPSFRDEYKRLYGGTKTDIKDKVEKLYMSKMTAEQLERIMLEALRAKFSQEAVKVKLLATGDAWLGETRRRGGGDWEVTKKGDPGRLGSLLMQVRNEI